MDKKIYPKNLLFSFENSNFLLNLIIYKLKKFLADLLTDFIIICHAYWIYNFIKSIIYTKYIIKSDCFFV